MGFEWFEVHPISTCCLAYNYLSRSRSKRFNDLIELGLRIKFHHIGFIAIITPHISIVNSFSTFAYPRLIISFDRLPFKLMYMLFHFSKCFSVVNCYPKVFLLMKFDHILLRSMLRLSPIFLCMAWRTFFAKWFYPILLAYQIRFLTQLAAWSMMKQLWSTPMANWNYILNHLQLSDCAFRFALVFLE